MVGELLQAAATNVLHAAAGPQDLRVERTYAVKTKNGPPRKVRLVANLYTEQAIQLLEGVPVSDNNQVKPPRVTCTCTGLTAHVLRLTSLQMCPRASNWSLL